MSACSRSLVGQAPVCSEGGLTEVQVLPGASQKRKVFTPRSSLVEQRLLTSRKRVRFLSGRSLNHDVEPHPPSTFQ